ncbi:hypothetical protein Tco_1315853 [Tanacetum coccineum]
MDCQATSPTRQERDSLKIQGRGWPRGLLKAGRANESGPTGEATGTDDVPSHLAQSEDYDEEREMEPRPEPARAVTPPLRAASPRVRRRRERVVGFEETQNRGESRVERNNEGGRPSEEASRGNGSQNVNLPPLLAAHIGRNENGQPLQSFLTSAYE